MPDQFTYLHTAQKLRNFDFSVLNSKSYLNIQVKTAGLLFALSPIPFLETVYSLAICNRFVYSALSIWLYSQKNLRGWPLLFFLSYPSLILYSSLSLRDTFVMTFMVIATIFFIEKKWVFASLAFVLLCFLKPQNGILLFLFFAIYAVLKPSDFLLQHKFIILSSIGLSLFFFSPVVMKELNDFREIMFIQNGGQLIDYTPIQTVADAIKIGLASSLNFFMKPLPWLAEGAFQKIQAAENIFIAFLVVFFLSYAAKTDKNIALTWSLLLLVSMSVYSIVVFNYGSAVRYKMPFVVVFFVGLSYDYFRSTGLYLDRYLSAKKWTIKLK
jgi:Gpi18-like mannosyltransferase